MSRRIRALALLVVAWALAWSTALVATPAFAQAKILRVATDTNLPWLDPHWLRLQPPRALLSRLRGAGHDRRGLRGDPAAGGELDREPQRDRLHLQAGSGVKVHNGRTVTADDVKASIDRFVQVGIRRGDLAAVQAVTVVDPATVRISLKEAQGSFLGALANPVALLWIMPKDLVQGAKDPLQPPQLVGTGPFQLAAWVRDQQITLKRFDDYTRDRRLPASGLGGDRSALVDEVHIISTGESATRFAGLERGDFDYAMALAPTAYERLRASTALDAIVLKPFTQVILQLNANRAPFNQVKARQAVSRGLDMETVMRGVTGNQPALPAEPEPLPPRAAGLARHHGSGGLQPEERRPGPPAPEGVRLRREADHAGHQPRHRVALPGRRARAAPAGGHRVQGRARGTRLAGPDRAAEGGTSTGDERDLDPSEPTGSTSSSAAGRPTRLTATATPRWTRRWRRACGSVSRRSGPRPMPRRRSSSTRPCRSSGWETVPVDGASKTVKGYKVFFLRRFWNVSK